MKEAAIAALVVVNLVTMALYAYDKSAAAKGRGRVRERTLHLLALFGGSPAAFLSQRLFRHKTIKTSFQIVFWMIVLLQAVAIGGAYWWATTR